MATEFAYDIELSKDKKTLILTVELPEREYAREPILECTNANALDIIKGEGFSTFQLKASPGTLSNWVSSRGKGGARRGEYVFAKKETETKAKAATKKTTTKKTTAKKTTTTN